MTSYTTYLIRLLCAVIVVAVLWRLSVWYRRRRGPARPAGSRSAAATERTLTAFRTDPENGRGWLAFSVQAEPHSLIVTRNPETIPHLLGFAFPPKRFFDAETFAAFVVQTETVHRLRFLHIDGGMAENTVRPGGSLVQGEDHVRAMVARAFADDHIKTAKRTNSAEVFATNGK